MIRFFKKDTGSLTDKLKLYFEMKFDPNNLDGYVTTKFSNRYETIFSIKTEKNWEKINFVFN